MSTMYQEIILDHYRNPRNYGTIEGPDIKARDSNPICGDVLELQLKLDGDGRVKDVKFNGRGCAISQASASMLTEMIEGKGLDEVRKLAKQDILDMLGIELSHARIKCALLSLKVLKLGVYAYLGAEATSEEVKALETVID